VFVGEFFPAVIPGDGYSPQQVCAVWQGDRADKLHDVLTHHLQTYRRMSLCTRGLQAKMDEHNHLARHDKTFFTLMSCRNYDIKRLYRGLGAKQL